MMDLEIGVPDVRFCVIEVLISSEQIFFTSIYENDKLDVCTNYVTNGGYIEINDEDEICVL